jgi:hypothetical protein
MLGNTAVSRHKNNYDEAMQALRRFGIDEYFIFPQTLMAAKESCSYSNREKSQHQHRYLALIDDQPFELVQVACVYPEIRTIDASEIPLLLQRPEFDVPVTDESGNRRSFYSSEEKRIT